MKTKIKEIGLTIPYDSVFTDVLLNLGGQGYSHVIINYSGGGDSGAIDEINLIKKGGVTEYDTEWKLNNKYEFDNPNDELSNILNKESLNQLLDKIDDWWNNDGGGGKLFICTYNSLYYCDSYTYETISNRKSLKGRFTDS